jgi:lipopolysaccharide export system protein LptC
MVLSASWQDAAAEPPGDRDRLRRRRALEAARRHSRWVRRLRIGLPALGVFAVAALVVLTRFGLPEDLDLSTARLSVTPSSIIMDRPHLRGFDKNNREFSVAADRAIQALMNPDEARLENIEATLETDNDAEVTIAAEAGDYDQRENKLKLHGAIAVDSTEGYAVRMTDADIDLEAGTMNSPNPATVTYQGSQVVGQSFSMTDNGKVIVFEGGVRTTLVPKPRGADSAATIEEERTP